MNPMLASDWAEGKLRFPCLVQPKIDGVRGLNTSGVLTGRSLKTHKNLFTTAYYSTDVFKGFDGELAAAHECDPDLCRKTSSALSTIEGEPFTLWHVFDFLVPETQGLRYIERYDKLKEQVIRLQTQGLAVNLRLVPTYWAHDLQTVLDWDSKFLDMGYEGTIIRGPDEYHKEGRSTVREMGLLRIKRFIEEEAVILEIIEGEANENEALTNELGLTYRTSHQENKVKNGMVGAMMCRILKDIFAQDGSILFEAGSVIKVGAGRMPHSDRLKYFANPKLLLEQTIKFKTFLHGAYNKPRFPTFQTIRIASDV